MTLRVPYTLKKIEESNELLQNFQHLDRDKLESRYRYSGSASQTELKPFQSLQSGDALFSANGSQATVRSFPLAHDPGVVVSTWAHCMDPGFLATVTDITATSITVQCTAWSQTAGRAFSDTTTQAVQCYFNILSHLP